MRHILISLIAMAVLAASPAKAETQEYNIFAVPSQSLTDYIANFGAKMKQETGLETFEQRGFLPHATLYLTSFKADDLDAVKAKVKDLAADMKAFPLQIRGTHLTGGRWYFLDIVQSKALQRASDTVVLALEPLRNPDYLAPGWVKCCENKQKTFARYGSPNVFVEFNPHFTQLAGEKSPRLDAFIDSIKDMDIAADGEIIGLGFAPVNPLGQAQKGDEVIYLFGQ